VQRLRGAAPRRAILIAVLAAAVAFAGCFAIGRSVARDDTSADAAPTRMAPERLVTISNLERAPSMKPLRSAAGVPPAAKTAPAPAPASAAASP
jgi:hypothetical protein